MTFSVVAPLEPAGLSLSTMVTEASNTNATSLFNQHVFQMLEHISTFGRRLKVDLCSCLREIAFTTEYLHV